MSKKVDIKGPFHEYSLADITAAIRKDPTFIYKNKENIRKRLSEYTLKVTRSSSDVCILSDIGEFMNTILQSNFDEISFKLMKEFVPSVMGIGKWDGFVEGLTAKEKMVLMLLFSREDLKKMEFSTNVLSDEDRNSVLTMLYYNLIDMHLTTMFPSGIVSLFIGVPFEKIISGDFTSIQSKLEKDGEPIVSLKDAMVIFKAVNDIYDNEEACYEFLAYYIKRTKTVDSFGSAMDVISNRYTKYLTDEDMEDNSFIMYLTQTLGGDINGINNQKVFDEECDDFLNACDEYEKLIPNNIMRCLIGDCTGVLKDHPYLNPNMDRVKYITDRILNKWGKTEEVAFDFPQQGYRNNPIEALDQMVAEEKMSLATEATHKDSLAMNAAGKKIYKAYRTYKESEEKVDSQITKGLIGLKNVVTGDVRSEVIEGKKFSAIGLLKKLLGTVAIFSFGKIRAVIFLVVRYALKKKTTQAERRKIILELETELEMITEKIEDARGDGNREAKYAMMRTKKELENAKKRIEYGLEASERDVRGAKSVLSSARAQTAGGGGGTL